MKYKFLYATGYSIDYEDTGNIEVYGPIDYEKYNYGIDGIMVSGIDVFVFLETDEVYVITFITPRIIQILMHFLELPCYFESDMIVVQNFKIKTIKNAICEMIQKEAINKYCSKIGTIYSHLGISSKEFFEKNMGGYTTCICSDNESNVLVEPQTKTHLNRNV